MKYIIAETLRWIGLLAIAIGAIVATIGLFVIISPLIKVFFDLLDNNLIIIGLLTLALGFAVFLTAQWLEPFVKE